MQWLKDKVAVVTGGASGIGRAVVKRYIEEGAKVCVADINEIRLAEVKKEFGNDVTTVRSDVTSLEDNKKAVAAAVSAFGKLDIFVGNAAVWDANRLLLDLNDTEIDKGFDQVFGVNVKGYLFGAKAAMPELLKTKGCIVYTLSNSSFYTGGGGPIYVGTKHAAAGLVRELAFELAPDIRVNAVAPGGTATNLRNGEAFGQPPPPPPTMTNEARAERMKLGNPLRVAATPEVHVAAYVFLASNEAKAATGTILSSDGGLSIRGAKHFLAQAQAQMAAQQAQAQTPR